MDAFINLIEGILSPCICIHIVPFKYLMILSIMPQSSWKKKESGDANRAEKLITGHSITKRVNVAVYCIYGKQIVNYTFLQLLEPGFTHVQIFSY